MIKRRLYLQIYATIFACLLAIVLTSAIGWAIFDRDRFERDIFDITGQLAYLSIPPASAPVESQRKVVERLGSELKIGISLFSPDRSLIASYGHDIRTLPPPRKHRREGWTKLRGKFAWMLELPDSRWLVVDMGHRAPRRPFLTAILYIGTIALVIFLVAYPLVRRLTRRLEKLNRGVELVGAGNLSARVDVEGSDEVGTLAKNFNSAAEQIQRLVDSNRLLLANASHELRTPLARIRLGVELLKEKKSAERQASLEADINELDGLIDEILLMSRLDAKQNAISLERVDLLGVLAEECSRYDNCTLVNRAGQTSVETDGDSRLLRRLVRNLLDNAQKHGGGTIIASIDQHASNYRLTVSDSGQGISEQDLEKIFEPFFRASTKQNIQGYGLGLALVKQIADAHDATIDVQSKLGEGTNVSVTFSRIETT